MKYLKYIFILSLLFVLYGCNEKTFAVRFEMSPGAVTEAIVVEKNTVLTNLPSPEKVGYDFDGWYLDSDFNNIYNEDPITSNITLYAKWTIKEYTVKFFNGSNELASIKVKHGEGATAPDNPTRVGHLFQGWDKEFSNITDNLFVNAVFDIQKFTVNFVDDDNTVLKTESVDYNTEATAPQAPIKAGYNFVGWDIDFSNVTANITVKAEYEIKTYEVKFMVGVNQIGDTQIIEHGSNAIAPNEFTIDTGYQFTKWSKEFTQVTENLTIYAEFSPIVYSITYYDGEDELTHNPSSYTILDYITLPQSLKTGHIFVGWFTNSDFSDEVVTTIATGATEDLVLYGKWLDESLKHTLSFELNGGSWVWTTGPTDGLGIQSVSNLPEIFMIDFYTYLKDNNLLNSSIVATTFRKTTWAGFSVLDGDPKAIYNKTTNSVYTRVDGYSQFFYDTATGNNTTGELLTIQGGFFGTEPYKSKYYNFVQNIAYMQKERYGTAGNYFWNGAQGKSGAGFIIDGYFYNTQGLREGNFTTLRQVIPNTNLGYSLSGTTLTPVYGSYPKATYVQGTAFTINALPSRSGHVFGGWYDNPDFNGDKVTIIPVGITPAAKYYAKWIPAGDY